MLQTGNLVQIHFQDRPRSLQPAGIYWLEAGTVALVDALASSTAPSNAAWPYRIPSLICGTANVLLTASVATALFVPEAGFIAGLLLATGILFNAEGRMATIDTTLLTTILVALRALLAVRTTNRPGAAALYWAALGCGLMLKGPVALIPILLTPLALSVTERSLDTWRRLRPLWGVPITLAVVAPWCIAIGHATHGRFFATALGHNLLGKVAGAQEAHGAPPGTHLALFIATFWPGSLFALLAVPFAWTRRREPAIRFLLCWLVPTWLIFELVATKLPHYVLPTFPAVAALTAASLLAPVPPTNRFARTLAWLAGGLWLTAGLAFAAAGPVLLATLQHTANPVGLAAAVAGATLLIASATTLARRRARQPAFLLAAAGAFILYAGLFTTVVPNLTTLWLSPRIADTVRAVRPCPESVLASTSFSEPSLVFLAGENSRLTVPAEAARLLATDRCALALVGTRDQPAFDAALTVPVRKLATVTGLNYSNGRHLVLSLYTGSPRQ